MDIKKIKVVAKSVPDANIFRNVLKAKILKNGAGYKTQHQVFLQPDNRKNLRLFFRVLLHIIRSIRL